LQEFQNGGILKKCSLPSLDVKVKFLLLRAVLKLSYARHVFGLVRIVQEGNLLLKK